MSKNKPWVDLYIKPYKDEEFKDILGFWDYYSVSNYGRIKSEKRQVRCGRGSWRTVKERILAVSNSKVNLSKDGKVKTYLISHLVYLTFIGEKPNGNNRINLISHWNKNKLDNRLCNLKLMVSSDSVKLDYKLGKSKSQIQGFRPNIKQKYKSEFSIRNKKGEETHRICTKCLKKKSIDNFYKFKNFTTYKCAECNLKYNQKVKNLNSIKIARIKEKEGLKKCSTCKQFKSFSNFHKNKNAYLGLANECKLCRSKRNRK